MKVKGKVIIRIPTVSQEDCRALSLAVSIDEHGLPNGLSSSIKCDDGVMVYELIFDVDNNRFLSIYNTLDDLIRSVKIVINSTKNLR